MKNFFPVKLSHQIADIMPFSNYKAIQAYYLQISPSILAIGNFFSYNSYLWIILYKYLIPHKTSIVAPAWDACYNFMYYFNYINHCYITKKKVLSLKNSLAQVPLLECLFEKQIFAFFSHRLQYIHLFFSLLDYNHANIWNLN